MLVETIRTVNLLRQNNELLFRARSSKHG